MIVKVQIPLASTDPDPPALIYPESDAWREYMPMKKLPAPVKRACEAGDGKAYFYAHIARPDKGNMLDFGVQAPAQEW
jgi:hypothetical protein